VEAALITEAGLTEGEAKVYLSLLQLGSSTSGPIAEHSGVANSVVYRILHSLVQKGLGSFIIKEKTRYFQAAPPERLLDYIDERKQKLDESKEKIRDLIPKIKPLANPIEENSVVLFEGFKGFQTAWELQYSKLKQGDEYYCWGVPTFQEQRFHLYWQRDHLRRSKTKIKSKILVNQGTDKEILKNRNSYKDCDTRYIPTSIKTPAWFVVYKDVTGIFLQDKKPIAVNITNRAIAETFKAYFDDFWRLSKPFQT